MTPDQPDPDVRSGQGGPTCIVRQSQFTRVPPRRASPARPHSCPAADPFHHRLMDLPPPAKAPISHLYRTLQQQGHVRSTMRRALQEATGQVPPASRRAPRTLRAVACQLTALTECMTPSGAPQPDHTAALQHCFPQRRHSAVPHRGLPARPQSQPASSSDPTDPIWGRLAPTEALLDTPFHQFFLTQVALRAADDEVAEELRGAAYDNANDLAPPDSEAILQLLCPDRPSSAPAASQRAPWDGLGLEAAGSEALVPPLVYQGLLGNLEALTWDHVAQQSCLRPQTCPRWMGPAPDVGALFDEPCTAEELLDGRVRLLRQVGRAPPSDPDAASTGCWASLEDTTSRSDDIASVSSWCSTDPEDPPLPTPAGPSSPSAAVALPAPGRLPPQREGRVPASHMAAKQYPWPDALPDGAPPAIAVRPWEAKPRKPRVSMLGFPSLFEWRRSTGKVRTFPLLHRLPPRRDGGAIVADDPVEVVANVLSEAKLLQELVNRQYGPTMS
eukprot:EG_transcript_5939